MPRKPPAIRVLVVDDDEAICEFMETFLQKEGFEVTTLTDPQGAEEAVRQGGYHILVLDLMMPAVEGLEVLRRIRKVDDDIAVIVFTGYPSLESAVEAMELDAVGYLQKPFDPERFREVLERVVRKKGLLRSPEEDLQRVIGQTIRNLRKEQGLTLKQMARRTGLSVSLLSQIERAESSASISSLYKIATALDRPMSTFFGDY